MADSEIARLRNRQIARVMPLIGGLLDAWEGMPNDLRGDLRDGAPALVGYLNRIASAMEQNATGGRVDIKRSVAINSQRK